MTDAVVDFYNFTLSLIERALSGDMAGAALTSLIYSTFTYFPEQIFSADGFQKIYDFFVPIALVFAVIYVLFDILEKVSMDNVSLDSIIKSLFKLVLAFGLISNGVYIFYGFNGATAMITEKIMSAAGDQFNDATTVVKYTHPVSGTLAILKLLMSFTDVAVGTSYALQLLYTIIYLFIAPMAALTRALKLGIYCIMSPFVFADVSGHGISGTRATKFAFRVLAVFLEFPIIIIGLVIVGTIRTSANINMMSPITSLITDFVLLGIYTTLIFSANKFVKNLFE